MSEIIDKIVNIPQREKGGSTAFNRFSYQNNWALCHLLELHKNGNDYIVALECHDDVLEVDFSSSPSLKFFQIKTKRTGALKMTNSKELSYLGKLYCNYKNFPEDTAGLFLVSNNSYIVSLDKGDSIGREQISLTDINDKDLQKIIDGIKNLAEVDNVKLDIISLIVSPLHIDHHLDYARGKVSRFLEEIGKESATIPFHQALSDEISRRAAFEAYDGNIKTFHEQKAISRDQFQRLLDKIVLRPDYESASKDILHRLDSEKVDFLERKAIQVGLEYYIIDLFSPQNECLDRIQEIIENTCDIFLTKISGKNFYELINIIFESVREQEPIIEMIQNRNVNYIKAIIAVKLYEK